MPRQSVGEGGWGVESHTAQRSEPGAEGVPHKGAVNSLPGVGQELGTFSGWSLGQGCHRPSVSPGLLSFRQFLVT